MVNSPGPPCTLNQHQTSNLKSRRPTADGLKPLFLNMSQPRIAIAPFLKSCPGVVTLGVRAAISDYPPGERRLMASAERIFFPTPRFAKIFEASGGNTFPNAFTYRLRKSRLVQESLFQFSGCPHPRARIYFGRRKTSIPSDFRFPFIAMGPNRADDAQLVEDFRQLADMADRFNPLIIREHTRYDERLLLVFVNYECVAVQRDVPGGLFFSTTPANHPPPSLYHAVSGLLRSFQVCDIAVETGYTRESGWLIDSLGRPPLSWQTPAGTMYRHDYISELIQNGKI